MFDFSSLPISPEQCRAARNYFGWSQAKAAEESSLPLHKLKRFESGNYIPDAAFLEDLRAFYEKQGYAFENTPQPGAKAKNAGQVFPAGVVDANGKAGETQPEGTGAERYHQRATASNVHHMRIAVRDDAEMGGILDLIEENEERVSAFLKEPVKRSASLFSTGIADGTQSTHAQVVALLAENGTLFAKLFGRDIGGKPTSASISASKSKPETNADLLHSLQGDAHLATAGDADAKARVKARSKPQSVFQALGLS